MFESNNDAPYGTIHQAYEERWLIKMVFRYYKNVNKFDETRMHSNYSVISSEFVCFLSTIVTGRLLKRIGGAPFLKTSTTARRRGSSRRPRRSGSTGNGV